jgi:peptidoglycan/xylan/chitin deacetylase (PgdA/CDA1 family)
VGVCAVALSGPLSLAFGADPLTARRAQAVLYRPVGCRVHGPTQPYVSGPARKVVAISFDDGPGLQTPAFVSMLEENRVAATFFMIGEQVTTSFGPTLRRELRDGDALGNHTYTHANLTRSGDIYAQLEDTTKAVQNQTGYTPCVFRPPFGDYDPQVLQTARSLGMATVLWDVDPADYTQPGTQTIVDRVLAEVRPGSIIVSHDTGGPRVGRRWRARLPQAR